MSRYDTYKETDVIWFKELPAHWKRKRVKDVTQTLAGGTPDTSKEEYWEGNIPWLPSGKVQNSIINEEDADTFITEEGLKNSATKMLPAPATLIALTGATCSNIGYLTFNACANQSVVGMPGSSKMLPKFLFYTLQSQKEQILLHQTGGAQGGISESDVKFLFIPVPIESEQLSIAHYLDDQTQKIDQLIANKKAQVEKLKELRQIEINNAVTKGLNPNTEMKDSGIEWLGKIPKHWEVKRLKNILLNINSGDGISNDELVEDGEIEVYGGNGVMGYTDKFNSDGKVIIIGRVGAKCGVTYLVDKKIWISDNALQSRTYQNYEFVYYLIDAMNLNNYANQNAQPLITGGILKGLYAALPPKNEQVEIADFLQQRTTAIDQLIKNIEAQIEKLQELRKIKIYEAVTGKIKVNAYAETTA